MKRLLGYFIVVALLLTVPFMSVAKQTLSDGEMGSLTAQEGVTIDLGAYDPATLNFGVMVTGLGLDLQSWGDSDGFTGYTDSGWFGSTMTTSAMSHVGVGGAMTIDVGTNAGGTTAVRIGLPHAIVHTFNTNQTLRLGTDKTLSDSQPSLGTTYNSVFAAMINPTGYSALTISAHAGEGVDINFGAYNPALPTVLIPGWGTAGTNAYMTSSWGDADGFTGFDEAAGYFGTVNMLVGDAAGLYIWLSGTMSIDVGTDGTGQTGVNIALPVVNIYTDGITQPLALSVNRNLSSPQMLGTSYMGGVQATITGGLTITAHGSP